MDIVTSVTLLASQGAFSLSTFGTSNKYDYDPKINELNISIVFKYS